MSWKCNICDSYNGDDSAQCYVCGQLKPSQPIVDKIVSEETFSVETSTGVVAGDLISTKSSYTGFAFCGVVGAFLWI